MNWDDLRIVLAIAEQKTMRLASEKLETHATTVLRRLNAFEETLGIRLFDRFPEGYLPTKASEPVFRLAAQMEDHVHEMRSHGRTCGCSPIKI